MVAVDVGNSAVKLCVRREDTSSTNASDLIDFRVPIDQHDWPQTVIQWVRDHVGCRQSRWRIASVHRSAAKTLDDAISRSESDQESIAAVDFITRQDVPMKAMVDQPDRLGIDRLLSAFGAFQQINAPMTIVDAGSAVTIDWVNAKGEFCGGAILPGLRMQAAALAKGTDALPEIDWQSWNYHPQAASNTIDAIRLGLITGVTAAIDRLSLIYGASTVNSGVNSGVNLVLTGGDAEAISPFVEHAHTVVPNLVCRGLLDLPRSS